jgi:putative hydrolase of the HAD superfamily
MPETNHIFFDLDHTLWDYERCANETLTEIFHTYRLEGYKINPSRFIKAYHEVNWRLWGLYNEGKIDRNGIREKRFRSVMSNLGVYKSDLPFEEISDYFIKSCSSKPHLFPGTIQTLKYLQKKYTLHILTNSFKEIAQSKLTGSKILPYFETIVSSECSPYRKPERGVFEFALNKAQAKPEESIMVGDNPESDAAGAQAAGMASILFNPEKKVFLNTYNSIEIQELSELQDSTILNKARVAKRQRSDI